jgi:O-antigen/teichoic acid export membrane protein
MSKNSVRIHYSGLVIFAAKIISISTGMVFTYLLTRNTTQNEYGVWANIYDLMAYFTVLATALPFWSTRFVARGKEGSTKTCFSANLIIALISVALYVPVISLVAPLLGISEFFLVLYIAAAAQIVESYLIQALEASIRAKRPALIGYALLLVEIVKISFAYVLIVLFHQPLFGALISLVSAFLIQILFYVKLTWTDFKEKIQWTYVKEWLKGSILNIYQMIGNQTAAFVFIMLFTIGGEAARGNFQAALTISNVVAYSTFLSFALYPKILAEKSLKDVTTSLKLVLMFAIPLAAGALAIPESFLTILGPQYESAWPILSFLAIDALVLTISQFYSSVLFGVEEFDEQAKIPTRQLMRTSIFKVFSLSYVHAMITLPVAYYVLTNFAANAPVNAALYVTIINMSARIAMFAVLMVIVRRKIRITVPWKTIGKFVLAAFVMGSTLHLLPHPSRILTTLAAAAAGGIVYLVLVMAMDKDTRVMAKFVWQEIRARFS